MSAPAPKTFNAEEADNLEDVRRPFIVLPSTRALAALWLAAL